MNETREAELFIAAYLRDLAERLAAGAARQRGEKHERMLGLAQACEEIAVELRRMTPLEFIESRKALKALAGAEVIR